MHTSAIAAAAVAMAVAKATKATAEKESKQHIFKEYVNLGNTELFSYQKHDLKFSKYTFFFVNWNINAHIKKKYTQRESDNKNKLTELTRY